MTLQVPWVISDVDEVPLEVARLLAYISVAGKEGIVGPGDLLVRATAVPGTNVRIAPGSFAALNRFVGASQQSYLGQNDAEITHPITQTGGAPRSDLLYVRINDSGQTGGGTSGVATIEVVEDVDPATTELSQVLSGVAGIALARIDMPASTSTVSQGYIKDLRKLVAPRREEHMRIANYDDVSTPDSLSSSSYITWPSAANWTIDIPSWAVRAQIVAWVSGYKVVQGNTSTSTNCYGKWRIQLGFWTSIPTYYNHNVSQAAGTLDLATTMTAVDVYIPVADRGTTGRTLKSEGLRDGGNHANSLIKAAWGTTVVVQVVFYETADDKYWA